MRRAIKLQREGGQSDQGLMQSFSGRSDLGDAVTVEVPSDLWRAMRDRAGVRLVALQELEDMAYEAGLWTRDELNGGFKVQIEPLRG